MELFVCLVAVVLVIAASIWMVVLARGANVTRTKFYDDWKEFFSAWRDAQGRTEKFLVLLLLFAQVLCKPATWTVVGGIVIALCGMAVSICSPDNMKWVRDILRDFYEFVRGLKEQPSSHSATCHVIRWRHPSTA